jgi:hypothetical protein
VGTKVDRRKIEEPIPFIIYLSKKIFIFSFSKLENRRSEQVLWGGVGTSERREEVRKRHRKEGE